MAGNVTGTTAANLIPEHWSQAIPDYAQASKRLISRVRDVSTLVPAGISQGDAVNVPRIAEESVQTVQSDVALTFGVNTEATTKLLIDQHIAVPKRIEDFAAVQANASLMDLYLGGMVYAWVKNSETFAADILQTATAHDVSLATDNQMTAAEFRSGEQNLMDEDYDLDELRDRGDLFMYSSPAIKQHLKGLGVFTDYDKTGEKGVGSTGRFGQAYGTPIISSTDWDSAGTTGEEGATLFARNSVLFAMQQNLQVRAESALPGGFLGTIVVVSGIFGAKLAYPVGSAVAPVANFNNP